MSNLIPAGIYRGRALKVDYKVSSKKETNFAEILCEVTAEGQYKGRRLNCDVWFNNEENAQRGMKTLSYCGWDGVDPIALNGFGSKEVDLVIGVEEAKPKEDGTGMYPERNRVEFINEQGSSVVGRSMNEAERLAFAGKLMGLAQKMNLGKSQAPQAAKDPQGGSGKIPF
jgi:hypothetical protein